MKYNSRKIRLFGAKEIFKKPLHAINILYFFSDVTTFYVILSGAHVWRIVKSVTKKLPRTIIVHIVLDMHNNYMQLAWNEKLMYAYVQDFYARSCFISVSLYKYVILYDTNSNLPLASHIIKINNHFQTAVFCLSHAQLEKLVLSILVDFLRYRMLPLFEFLITYLYLNIIKISLHLIQHDTSLQLFYETRNV